MNDRTNPEPSSVLFSSFRLLTQKYFRNAFAQLEIIDLFINVFELYFPELLFFCAKMKFCLLQTELEWDL